MFCAGEWRRWAVLYLCGCAFLARFRFGPEAALGASPGQFDLGPGGFPQRAHGYPDAFAGGLYWRPEPEAAGALVGGGALPIAGHALVLVPRVVGGVHLEAGCDHGPVFPVYPRSEEHTSELQSPVHLVC